MIKQKFFKTLAVTVAILFFLLTGADMYLKTYGDISRESASKEAIEEIESLSDYYNKKSDRIRIMTYNVLADSVGFEGTPVVTRADGVCRIIEGIAPDVCGFQEMNRKWFACVYNNTDYKFIHPVRTALFDTMTVLAYNPRTVVPLSFGEQVFKNSNGSLLRRMVWGVFVHRKTNSVFAVVNTHFSLSDGNFTDNTTPLTQALELITLCKELKNLFGCPVFPVGDFNAKESTRTVPSPIYNILCAAFTNTAHIAEAVSNGENTLKKQPSVDHIFAFGDAEIPLHTTLSQSTFKAYSDHFPVFCDINI